MSINRFTTAIFAYDLADYADRCSMSRDELLIDIIDLSFDQVELDQMTADTYHNLLNIGAEIFADRSIQEGL